MPPRYSEDEARAAIAASRSYAEALRRLGMCPSGGGHTILKKYAEQVWHIAVDHFDPHAASREALRSHAASAIPLEEILATGRPYSRFHLKQRLYATGLKHPSCELCGQGELWRGKRMSLILDHVNGVRDDNRLENLRIVCPNCAATLDTHCGRKQRRAPVEANCARCGATFRPRYSGQRHCGAECGRRHDNRPQRGVAQPQRRKVPRPDIDRLLAEIDADGYLATGRRYGVSDNAVRKWRLQYEHELSDWAAAGCPGPAEAPL